MPRAPVAGYRRRRLPTRQERCRRSWRWRSEASAGPSDATIVDPRAVALSRAFESAHRIGGPAPLRATQGCLGRWLFDLDGCSSCLGLFVLSRGDHAERGVAALAVVERLDVLEYGGPELEPARPAAAVDELLLERREERLGDGVVVCVSAGAHRDRDPGLTCGPPEREADVLAALV